MKVLNCTTPGHFEYQDKPEPASRAGYSLLRIQKVGICGTDLHAYKGRQPYFEYPRILGHEVAAEYVSGDAPDIRPGDLCTFLPYISCGSCIACRSGKTNCCSRLVVCGVHLDGAMAEYYLVPSPLIIPGENLSEDELALVEPMSIAAHAIRRAENIKGKQVLIFGAGPIGMCTSILALQAGAVVGLADVHAGRLAFASSFYSIHTFLNRDPSHFINEVRNWTNGDMAPVVIDATGNLQAIESGLQYLAHGGQFILVGLQKEAFHFSHPEFHKREATLKSSRNATRKDFIRVRDLIKNKTLSVDPLITHRIPFGVVAKQFETLYDPGNLVMKAVIEF
ncbi:MAG TPA: zinc-binding alcohol dehydrogenase family protein [Saprospiraceae bacterium]|nr:zinc-binding alcohol dehydrogenase family protein [Saprospiraceae bacterium]HNT21556.1 zinc-binding alcohol dehydrogenase family protein [Saprospiraceae bacterium]